MMMMMQSNSNVSGWRMMIFLKGVGKKNGDFCGFQLNQFVFTTQFSERNILIYWSHDYSENDPNGYDKQSPMKEKE